MAPAAHLPPTGGSRSRSRMPQTKTQSDVSISKLQQHFAVQQRAMIAALGELVKMESPSSHKPSVDLLGRLLATRFAELGGKITRHGAQHYGDSLQIDFAGDRSARRDPVLLLGHFDTVWELGTLA